MAGDPGTDLDLDTPARDELDERILDATVSLAVEGGYEAVRQREVAARARVALGTLYARFEGKNALLAAALQRDAAVHLAAVRKQPLRGRTPLTRVTRFFERFTDELLARPNLARAALRAAISGERGPSLRLMHAQQPLISAVAEALQGTGAKPALPHEPAHRMAAVLVMVWYANLTAWVGGLAEPPMIVEVMRNTADMLLHGVQSPPSE